MRLLARCRSHAHLPFLADAGGRERLDRLLFPLRAPAPGLDPRASPEAGRLVWWHENLAAALDATGFCAFSAAALLSDGVCELAELWRWIAPPGPAPARPEGAPEGWELLAAGDALVALQRRLNELWGLPPDADLPPWARSELAPLWEEYRLLRGLDPRGRLTEEAWRRFEQGLPPELPARLRVGAPPAPRAARAPERSAPGTVVLRSSGALAQAMGERVAVRRELPATLEAVLADAYPASRPEPTVFRAGRRVLAGDLVHDGDELDLVLVVSGG